MNVDSKKWVTAGQNRGGALIDLAPSIFDLWTRCFVDKLSPTFVYFLGGLRSVGIAVAYEKHDLVRCGHAH